MNLISSKESLDKEEDQQHIQKLLETIREKDQQIEVLNRKLEYISQSSSRHELSPRETACLIEENFHPPQTPQQVNFNSLKEDSPSTILNVSQWRDDM